MNMENIEIQLDIRIGKIPTIRVPDSIKTRQKEKENSRIIP
jgi:hypothetical protein